MQTICEDLAASEHLIADHEMNVTYSQTSAYVLMILSQMSTRIQTYTQQFKELEEARIKYLQENGPDTSEDLSNLIVTLLRPDAEGVIKEKYIHLRDYKCSIIHTDEEKVREQFKLEGPPDADGLTYFLRADHRDDGQTPFGVWISKDEATKIKEDIKKLEDDEAHYEEDHECWFCGKMESECGADHSDEMRDILHENNRHY